MEILAIAIIVLSILIFWIYYTTNKYTNQLAKAVLEQWRDIEKLREEITPLKKVSTKGNKKPGKKH